MITSDTCDVASRFIRRATVTLGKYVGRVCLYPDIVILQAQFVNRVGQFDVSY